MTGPLHSFRRTFATNLATPEIDTSRRQHPVHHVLGCVVSGHDSKSYSLNTPVFLITACAYLPALPLHVHDELRRERSRYHEVLLVQVSVGRRR